MKLFVFSDSPDIMKQMLTYLREKGEITAATTSGDADIGKFGASVLYRLKGNHMPDSVARTVAGLVRKENYDAMFFGSTVLGREVAGFVSEDMGLTSVTEIVDLRFEGNRAVTKRFFLGGKTVLEEESQAKVFTVMPGITDPQEAGSASKEQEVQEEASALSLVEVQPKKAGTVDIEKAQIIVAVGRGLGKKEGLQQIEPFAQKINGVVAGSRPVCLDYQWLTEDRQVGLSGKKVKPKLYIALGISGRSST
ncbi:electron transfer flavoprotein subunit alpha/FixB family protein [Thermogymnomonas acidicola]|uniref:electron transfer flavoprotein subunit alpha/FixB family protein n=1 Tax=Thermogymnomonas acidicola TaxID=399579 RepID=UPI000A7814BB|nr:electron transfer flavoprotein subunit alpha/FixB family protein [Thermogymnomonas acidicola]